MRYLNALKLIEGVGSQKLGMLMNHFGSPEEIWKAGIEEITRAGISEKLAERIILERNNIDPEAEWEKLCREDIRLLTVKDEEYPPLLREIHLPPYIIYKKGGFNLKNLCHPIGVVGSRKYTSYGAQAAASIIKDLSTAGITTVSGMALGVDAIAHRAAIDAGGFTVAVLGNGLDDASIYPRENFNLSREIMDQGALISEYPAGTRAGKITFPARNRIIAGMSKGTLVVEAGEKSGSLITADYALEYNREVFAVPGSIFSPLSAGSNALLRSGAKMTGSAKDILDELDLRFSRNESAIPKVPENYNEEILLKILSIEPVHIDNIVRLAKLETMTVSSALTVMEIKGWVKNVGGQNYILL